MDEHTRAYRDLGTEAPRPFAQGWIPLALNAQENEVVSAAATKGALGYTSPWGDSCQASDVIATFFGLSEVQVDECAPEAQRVVTSGAKEGIYIALAGLSNQHKLERLVVPSPGWAPYRLIAGQLGCAVAPYLVGGSGWMDELQEMPLGSGDLVVINSPHNPTGFDLEPDRLAAVVYELRECGAVVLLDEVYRHLSSFDGSPIPHLDNMKNVVAVSSCSKALSVPGYRVGALIGDAFIVEEAVAVRSLITTCPSSVAEAVVSGLLRSKVGRARMDKVRAIARENLALTARTLAELDLEPTSAGGLFHWFASMNKSEVGVPGNFFGVDGGLRLTSAQTAADLQLLRSIFRSGT